LPDEKIVLEIDGEGHRLHRAKDSIRDEVIRYQLKGYQIVRIPASDLYQKPEALIDGITAVLDYRYNYYDKWIKK
jgi:very-short-patch-repair endonuclease